MRFQNNIIDKKVAEAIRLADGLLQAGSNMIEDVSNKNDFKYGSGLGVQVALKLIQSREPIKVHVYKPFYPFTKAIGYYDGECIWINIRRMVTLDVKDLVGLLLHEYAHYCKFMHGSNFKTKEKCVHSVPYYLSENISKWI